MSCYKRISETASDSSYIYQIFSCISENPLYINRLRFFKQVKDEIDRISKTKQSPEIISLVADWGQGKSTFLDIIEEYAKSKNINVIKVPFVELLSKTEDLLTFRNNVYLIDEVESSVDYFAEYQSEIKDFWSKVKELANSTGNSIVYLSMTPSAYSKIFGTGGLIYNLFSETYPSLLERIRKVSIENPSKLEFLLMLKCMLNMANVKDFKILQYMDLPYWVIDQERRKYVRFFNDILCDNLPNIDRIFNELARSEKGISLNSEGETIKLDTLTKIENELDSQESSKLYKVLMSRIFTDEKLIIKQLEGHVVKGVLIPYLKWIEIFPKGQEYVEDFLLTYYQDDFHVFISDNIESVVYESIDTSKLKENIKKLTLFSKTEAYALSWNFFESVANTNIGGLVVEFKSREIRDKALQFVNTYITDREKELESLEYFMEVLGIKIDSVNRTRDYIRFLKIVERNDKITIILAKPSNEDEIKSLIKEIKESDDIIHGLILIEPQIGKEELSKTLDELSIPLIELKITTPKKRQLLYLLFSKIYGQSRIRLDSIELRLGDLKNSISSLLLKIRDNLNLKQLPIPKNKRLIQSFNWIIFYPSIKMANADEVFDKVNDIINEKFRMYGSKQFHLEDIETSNTFIEDVVTYFYNNYIIKIRANYIDFEDLAGDSLSSFSKLFAGLIRQKYKQEAEDVIFNYIMYYVNPQDIKRKDNKNNPLAFAYQIFNPDKKIGQNPTLDFLVYSSIVSGEVAKYLNKDSIYMKINDQIRKIKEKLDNPYSTYGYFITAKKRGAAVRSLEEMREVIETYEKSCTENKDIRLCYDYLYLSNIYLELLRETEKSVIETDKIVEEISKKLEVVEKAKRYVKINEKIEEIEKVREIVRELKDNFKIHMDKLAKRIQEINERGETESFKRYLDYLLATIHVEDNSNLYFILFKLLKETLNGVAIVGEELKGTIVDEITSLSKVGIQLNNIETIVNELEKISPELPKLRENVERNTQKITQLIQEIKEVLEEHGFS
ncbi:MAG: P-loop NTPase fold protein [Saccharolobus sp.]|uniref:P-loop NTPase fold protein n=2 Tax=Sulfolobaceae TaxID=118883 RepID=UPI001F0E61D9|nr:P-loop NTPase fold protein [Saccharolobus shibatae]